MTLSIHFHQSCHPHFKAYYTEYVQVYLQSVFPKLVSYEWFVHLQYRALGPLLAYLHSLYGPVAAFRSSIPPPWPSAIIVAFQPIRYLLV